MDTAKEEILKRLKNKHQAIKSATLVSGLVSTAITGEHPTKVKTESQTNLLLKMFEENRIEARQVNPESFSRLLVELSKQKNIKKWLLGNGRTYQEQAEKALKQCSRNIKIERYREHYESLRTQLFHEIDASLTLAQGAIADTGTLLIVPDKHEPRMMSLIPAIHVVLLNEADIYPTFQTLIDSNTWHSCVNTQTEPVPTNIVFVSSPSKTADIQQTLAYGAHGPKEVIVLLLSE